MESNIIYELMILQSHNDYNMYCNIDSYLFH